MPYDRALKLIGTRSIPRTAGSNTLTFHEQTFRPTPGSLLATRIGDADLDAGGFFAAIYRGTDSPDDSSNSITVAELRNFVYSGGSPRRFVVIGTHIADVDGQIIAGNLMGLPIESDPQARSYLSAVFFTTTQDITIHFRLSGYRSIPAPEQGFTPRSIAYSFEVDAVAIGDDDGSFDATITEGDDVYWTLTDQATFDAAGAYITFDTDTERIELIERTVFIDVVSIPSVIVSGGVTTLLGDSNMAIVRTRWNPDIFDLDRAQFEGRPYDVQSISEVGRRQQQEIVMTLDISSEQNN